ncbi:hypothetical protein GCM10009785_13830 [Brooklawnia cerclae]|uniref:Uncharacterized protein n=1 Tax=Brooklawnia cerclae TaxID=349934 RepID=A0ABX0SI24_9ACTN|nr:hypothetical protein [Brooklawnia cerclae]NIH58048.1 hypothetical protein [Brooklawnia cerclae]NIH58521.1 hypothetical protein [Brooklawnia cerclae]
MIPGQTITVTADVDVRLDDIVDQIDIEDLVDVVADRCDATIMTAATTTALRSAVRAEHDTHAPVPGPMWMCSHPLCRAWSEIER